MQTQSLALSTGWRRPLWIALLVAASVAFTLGFACATPLAAFAAIAALSMPRKDALLLIGLVWLANQAIGFQAQIQSAIIFGVTAALYGEITLKNGRVEQTNFDTYQILRMNEAPAIEVHIVQNFEPPGGMGEAGTSAIVPAVINAIFAATGKRLRKLPIDTTALKQPP
jgi:hypothetical protein